MISSRCLSLLIACNHSKKFSGIDQKMFGIPPGVSIRFLRPGSDAFMFPTSVLSERLQTALYTHSKGCSNQLAADHYQPIFGDGLVVSKMTNQKLRSNAAKPVSLLLKALSLFPSSFLFFYILVFIFKVISFATLFSGVLGLLHLRLLNS